MAAELERHRDEADPLKSSSAAPEAEAHIRDNLAVSTLPPVTHDHRAAPARLDTPERHLDPEHVIPGRSARARHPLERDPASVLASSRPAVTSTAHGGTPVATDP